MIEKKRGILVIVFLVLFLVVLIVYATPTLHHISGQIFNNDSSSVPENTYVFINLTQTGVTYETYTYGPPFPPQNYYDYDVMGEDSELVLVWSWNATHYGVYEGELEVGSPSTTYIDVIINNTRDSESNVTIVSPVNDSYYPKGDIFNLTANITILGWNATDCTSTISFSDSNIIGVAAGDSSSHNLCDITISDWKNTTWSLDAKNAGSSNITVVSTCASDGINIHHLNVFTTYNITVTSVPNVTLEYPLNNSIVYTNIVRFDYNVTSDYNIENCTLILNGFDNETDNSISKDTTQSFEVSIPYAKYNWSVKCTDENKKVGESTFFFNLSVERLPDLNITPSKITFSDNTPYEGQTITIIANVSNDGSLNATGVVVRFYDGNYTYGNQIGADKIINIEAGFSNHTNETFVMSVGTKDIFVVVDPPLDSNGTFREIKETNNLASNSITVISYQKIMGNISGKFTLDTFSNRAMIDWEVTNTTGSNIYVADSDSVISFSSLKALSRDTIGNYVADDFTELDTILNITGNFDSINKTYTFEGNPKDTGSFTIFGTIIEDVPIINSTNTDNFITGILWDSSDDDSDNDEYDSTDQEDIIFITKVNENSLGEYGTYDYELSTPANLRSYISDDSGTLSLYAEIK